VLFPHYDDPDIMRFVASIRIFARAAAAHVSRTAARFAASPAPRRAVFTASAAAGFFASATFTAIVRYTKIQT
jgi:hypothetical protein